ncbi:MAG: diguanylate cyclase [Cellulomonas sp.]|nr:diguanylate cyclase [Cellulomonas sp.]
MSPRNCRVAPTRTTPWTPSPNRPPPGIAVHRRGPLLNITDTFGYETGDAVLRIVAWSTANRLRRGDVPTRWGGEEPWSCSPIPTRPVWKPRLSGYGYSYRRHSSDVGRRTSGGQRVKAAVLAPMTPRPRGSRFPRQEESRTSSSERRIGADS